MGPDPYLDIDGKMGSRRKDTIVGLSDFMLSSLINEFLLDDSNCIPFLVEFGTISRRAYTLSQYLIHTASNDLEMKIISWMRKFILLKTNNMMLDRCNGHFAMDNLANLKAHPYFTIRWLVYEPLPDIAFKKERRFFVNLFNSPYADGVFFTPTGSRTRERLIRQHNQTSMTFGYLKKQVLRRIECVSRMYSAWYSNETLFDRSIGDLLSPFCAFCLKKEEITNRSSFYCTVCSEVDPSQNYMFHALPIEPTSISTMVPVCKECISAKLPDCTSVQWHCPIGNMICCNHSHGSRGCKCPCHSPRNNKALEYIGFKSKMERLYSSVFDSSPYYFHSSYEYPATDESEDEYDS